MPASDFVQLETYISASEAEHVRSLLVEKGIAAFVDGANANTAMSYVGSALGGIRLFVRVEDVDKARQIVDSLATDLEQGGRSLVLRRLPGRNRSSLFRMLVVRSRTHRC